MIIFIIIRFAERFAHGGPTVTLYGANVPYPYNYTTRRSLPDIFVPLILVYVIANIL